MAEIVISFSAQTVGAQPSGSLDNINAVSNGAALTISQADPYLADLGARFVRMIGATAGTTQTAIKWLLTTLLGSAPSDFEMVSYIRLSAIPTADVPFLQLDDNTATPANSTQFYVRGATNVGRLAMLTKGVTYEIGTTAIPAGQWIRTGIRLVAGTSATTGQVRGAWALGDQTTLQADTGMVTGINTAATSGGFSGFRAGKYGTVNYAGNVDIQRIIIRTGSDISANFKPYTPAPVAPGTAVRPVSIISNPGNITSFGSPVSLAVGLSDASTATGAINPDAAADEAFTFRWPPLQQGSAVSAGFPLSLDAGSTTQAVKLEVLQGATVVATRTVTGAEMTSAGTTETNFNVDVTGTHKVADITWASGQAELWGRTTFKAS